MTAEADVVLSIIVPTYEERENLTELVERIAASLQGTAYEVWVVDDGSPDGTEAVARALSEQFPVRLLQRGAKRGLATAVLDGVGRAAGDVLCFMDADLSHPPEKLPEMLACLERGEADLVVGSRWVTGGGVSGGWPLNRKIDSYVASFLVRPLTDVRDSMSGFMMFRRSVIENVRLDAIGYKIGLEILVKGRARKTAELPIHFVDRNQGNSKMTLRVKLEFLLHIARLHWDSLLSRRDSA